MSPNYERNVEICRRYNKGERAEKLAKIYGVTRQRIHHVIDRWEYWETLLKWERAEKRRNIRK